MARRLLVTGLVLGIAAAAALAVQPAPELSPDDLVALAPDAPGDAPANAGAAEAAIFYLFAAVAVISAVAIVLTRDIVRAAVWLLGTLGGVAGLYFLMAANFLGAIQLIVYAGGTLVLIIFGVMLTSRLPAGRQAPRPWEILAGVLVCGAIFLALSLALADAAGLMAGDGGPAKAPLTLPSPLEGERGIAVGGGVSAAGLSEPARLGNALLTTYLIPFEFASVLLLVVMIGAAYLARPEKR